MPNGRCRLHGGFQHTAARRRLDYIQVLTNIHIDSFNTQPPEGGWFCFAKIICLRMGFNTQPPEGGWTGIISIASSHTVSTHSRPKAAGYSKRQYAGLFYGFNTQPPEGGWGLRR